MTRFHNYCLSGLLLGTVGAAGCGQGPTTPSPQFTTAPAGSVRTAAKPGSSLTPGFYQMLFLNGARQEVATLPIGSGSTLLVKVHVEDSAHLNAADGSVLFEICRWKGVSPTTGTRSGAAPSARCADGSARWVRHIDIPVNPQTGDAWAGIDFVNVACVMGWRATYRNSRTIAPGVMGPADIIWQ
jgi:hypothetical protein